MKVVKKEEYEKVFKSMNLSIEERDKSIDIYHKNNWDHFIMHWDEENRNDSVSYIDFFFDAKLMVDLFREFIDKEKFEICFIAPLYNDMYKLKLFDDAVCRDIYDEFKKLLNSLGLKVNTSSAVEMTKEEFLNWCDRFSIGGFCGVSKYVLIIPESNILIFPHHHMNYMIYSNNKDFIISELSNRKLDGILIEW